MPLTKIPSEMTSYTPSGTGAVATTVQSKLRETVSVKDFGADSTGSVDATAAFSAAGSSSSFVEVHIPAGVYRLDSNPAPTGDVTWVVHKGASFTGSGRLSYVTSKIVSKGAYRSVESDPTFYNGIFGYLEQNAAETGYGVIGLHGAVQSAGGSVGSPSADIAMAAFGANNLVGGIGGVWGMYSTVLRASGVDGPTHGMEIDIANFGATVPLFPHDPFAAGQTNGLWVASGGETTEPTAGGSPGVASVAIGIIRNDSQASPTASFDKGILFHNSAINGADGTGSLGCAIAFASGHAMRWFNNSGQICAEITSTGTTFSNANLRMDFSNSGLLVQDRSSGINIFQISNATSAVNRFNFTAAAAGSPVSMSAAGSDTNIDIYMTPKGTGVLRFGTWTTNADVAINGYITIKDNGGTTRKLATIA